MAFVKSADTGRFVGCAAIHLPTAGSSNARRQISARGKSASTGSKSTIVIVAFVHASSKAVEAEGTLLDVGVGLARCRERRYGRTVDFNTFFTSDLDWVDAEEPSIDDNSFSTTVSRGGTWEKMMAFVESACTAGIETEVCGWAAGCEPQVNKARRTHTRISLKQQEVDLCSQFTLIGSLQFVKLHHRMR